MNHHLYQNFQKGLADLCCLNKLFKIYRSFGVKEENISIFLSINTYYKHTMNTSWEDYIRKLINFIYIKLIHDNDDGIDDNDHAGYYCDNMTKEDAIESGYNIFFKKRRI